MLNRFLSVVAWLNFVWIVVIGFFLIAGVVVFTMREWEGFVLNNFLVEMGIPFLIWIAVLLFQYIVGGETRVLPWKSNKTGEAKAD